MSGFKEVLEYDDKHINSIYSNLVFLDELYYTMPEKISPEIILYSEYYWGTVFINEYRRKYHRNSGCEQFHFKLIERMEYDFGSVDISLLEKIETEISKIK
ncbi:MAG: hypothetical protein NC177_10755 [Ruminococcus flavefaciens]|nr:hypothetical protein [Ruminococcus flavefaciens]